MGSDQRQRTATLLMPSQWARGDTVDYDPNQVLGVRVVSLSNRDLTIGKVIAASTHPDGLILTAEMFDGYGYTASQHPAMYCFCPTFRPMKAQPPVGPRRHISECRVLSVSIVARDPAEHTTETEQQNTGRPVVPQSFTVETVTEEELNAMGELTEVANLRRRVKELEAGAASLRQTLQQVKEKTDDIYIFELADAALSSTSAGKALLDRLSVLEEQVSQLTKERDLLLEAVTAARSLCQDPSVSAEEAVRQLIEELPEPIKEAGTGE